MVLMTAQRTVAAPDPRRWRILTAVAFGSIMTPLDGSIINVALPAMSAALRADLTAVEWVATAYLLVVGTTVLTWGRLGDLVGLKRIFLAGLSLFSLGSLLCGLARSLPLLVAWRVLQAVGGGMLLSVGPGIITEAFPPQELGQALGWNGVVVALGLALGPTLGGILTGTLGWPWIFFVNVPVGIAGVIWGARILPEARGRVAEPFDIPGALLAGVAFLGILSALSLGPTSGFGSPAVAALFAAGAAGLVAFVLRELGYRFPMLDPALFRSRVFAAASTATLLNFLAQFAVTFLMPFYLETLRAMAPEQAGVLLTAFPLTMMLTAPLAGRLSDRMGTRLLASAGMGVQVLALLLIGRLGLTDPPLRIAAELALFGAGNGLFTAPNNSAVMGAAPGRRRGIAGGVLAMMRYLGMALGIALTAAIFAHASGLGANQLGAAPGGGVATAAAPAFRRAFLRGLHASYTVAAGLAVIGLVTSAVRGREQARAGA
jgi:EmrB/QacA subfamily drug resistance transporter